MNAHDDCQQLSDNSKYIEINKEIFDVCQWKQMFENKTSYFRLLKYVLKDSQKCFPIYFNLLWVVDYTSI